MTAVCCFAVVRLIHPAPPPLNTIGPPSLAITHHSYPHQQARITTALPAAEEKNTPLRHPRRQAGKNRRERFFASVASPKGAYQG